MAKPLTYKSSGVDIGLANRFVSSIKSDVKSTQNISVLNRSGSFGGLFDFNHKGYKDPVLVSSTDGVGTKLILAQELNKHNTVGIDLVAMNVNDILCVGAKPLFFLDYIACGKVKLKILKDVVKGIADGCKQSGCALIGGETAEMPDMYKKDEYDLAGFAVGVVDKQKILDGSKIKAGDVVLGLPSSGLHSNGYSLVRKVFSKSDQIKLKVELLKPTRIYAKKILPLIKQFSINGIAHITGGAFYDKLTKVLPNGLCFAIDRSGWNIPNIFQKIQKKGRISDKEMFRTFNMGVGIAVVLNKKVSIKVKRHFRQRKIKFFEVGEVVKNANKKILFK